MAPAPAPAMKAPPPAKAAAPRTAKPTSQQNGQFRISSLANTSVGERIVLYGEGGIGKTTLAASAPDARFIDLERGARCVAGAVGVEGVTDWSGLLGALRQEDLWEGCKHIVIDSATEAQMLATARTIATVKHEKGYEVKSIEGYGFGKGYQYVFETFLTLLAELDRHVANGRSVVMVCHSTVSTAPNPSGEDFLRHEPDLQQPNKIGRLRDVVKNWCDHMLYIGYDIAVSDDGKATGCGSRQIYTQEMPTHWAKSRFLSEASVPFPKGSTDIWNLLAGGPAHAAS